MENFSYQFSCDFCIRYEYYYKEIQIIYSIICMFIEEHTFRNIAFYHIALRPPYEYREICRYVCVVRPTRIRAPLFPHYKNEMAACAMFIYVALTVCAHIANTHTDTILFAAAQQQREHQQPIYILVFKNFYGQFIFFSVIFLCLRCGRRYVWVVALKRAYICVLQFVLCVCVLLRPIESLKDY